MMRTITGGAAHVKHRAAEVGREKERAWRGPLLAAAAMLTAAAAVAAVVPATPVMLGLLAVAAALAGAAWFVRGGEAKVEKHVEERFGNLERLRLTNDLKLDEARDFLDAEAARAARIARRWEVVTAAGLTAAGVLGGVLVLNEYNGRQVYASQPYMISAPLAPYQDALNDPATQPVVLPLLPPKLIQPTVEAERTTTAAGRNLPGHTAELVGAVESNLLQKADTVLNTMEGDIDAAKASLEAITDGQFPPDLRAKAREQIKQFDAALTAAKTYRANPNANTKGAMQQQVKTVLEKIVNVLKALQEFIKALCDLFNSIFSGAGNGTGVSASGARKLGMLVNKATSGGSITPEEVKEAENALRDGQRQVGSNTFTAPWDPTATPPDAAGTGSGGGLLTPIAGPTQPRKVKPDHGEDKTKQKIDPKSNPGGVVPNG